MHTSNELFCPLLVTGVSLPNLVTARARHAHDNHLSNRIQRDAVSFHFRAGSGASTKGYASIPGIPATFSNISLALATYCAAAAASYT